MNIAIDDITSLHLNKEIKNLKESIYKKSKLDHHTNSSIKNKIEQYKVLENIFEYLNSLSNNSSLKNDEKINLKHDLKLVLNKIKSLKKEIKEIKNK
jgi:hypothetical protein